MTKRPNAGDSSFGHSGSWALIRHSGFGIRVSLPQSRAHSIFFRSPHRFHKPNNSVVRLLRKEFSREICSTVTDPPASVNGKSDKDLLASTGNGL
jgi:hypothetical protein